jgi:hypothetical protein
MPENPEITGESEKNDEKKGEKKSKYEMSSDLLIDAKSDFVESTLAED